MDAVGTWEERMAARHAIREARGRGAAERERRRQRLIQWRREKCWCQPDHPDDQWTPPDHVCEHGYRPEDNMLDAPLAGAVIHCRCCHGWFGWATHHDPPDTCYACNRPEHYPGGMNALA